MLVVTKKLVTSVSYLDRQIDKHIDGTTLQPPLDLSVGSLCHPRLATTNHLSVHRWIRTAFFSCPTRNRSYRFPILKLPPPPCVVLPGTKCANFRQNFLLAGSIAKLPRQNYHAATPWAQADLHDVSCV